MERKICVGNNFMNLNKVEMPFTRYVSNVTGFLTLGTAYILINTLLNKSLNLD